MIDPREYLPQDMSPAGFLKSYYGDYVLPALKAPRQAVLAPFGGQEAVDAWSEAGQADMAQNSWNPINRAISGSGLGQFAFETATDPLSYVGIGLPGKIATRMPRLGAALGAGENVVNKVINEALLAPAKVPMKALNIPLPGFGLGNKFTRTVVDPLTDSVNTVPSKSVGDYLWGGKSRPSLAHEFGQSVQDMSNQLMERGHELELDMADFANARAGRTVPKYVAVPDPFNPVTSRDLVTNMQSDLMHRLDGLRTAGKVDEANSIWDALNNHMRDVHASPPGTPEEVYRAVFKIHAAADHAAGQVDRGLTGADNAFSAVDRRVQALHLLESGRPGILADLPEQLQPRAEVVFRTMDTHGKELIRDRETIESSLKELWDLKNSQAGGALGNYVPLGNISKGDDAIREINARLGSLGMRPITATTESPFSAQFRNQLMGVIPDTTINKLDDVLKTWGASGDPLTENAYKLVFDRVTRDRAGALGMSDGHLQTVMDGLNGATSLWKSIQLMSPSYLLTNALSGMTNSAMMGVNPVEIAGNLRKNILTALRKEEVMLPEELAQNTRLGRPTPSGATSATGFLQDANELRDQSGKGVDILNKVGWGRMAGAGGLVGAAEGYRRAQETPEDDTLQKTLLGTGTGMLTFGTMPWMSRHLYQPLAQGTEQVLRKSAVITGRENFLNNQVDALHGLIDTAAHLGGPGLSPAQSASVRSMIESKGSQLSSQDVGLLLEQVGVNPRVRAQATKAWENILQKADDAGVHLSNQINFDYGNLNNFEEFTRQVLPFSTWATKAFPFFAARVAEHPIIGSTIARFEDESEKQRKAQGLSPRFAGSVEVPPAQHVWEALTGRSGQRAFYNPLKSFVPAGDAARAGAFTPDGNQTAWQGLTDVLDLLGYSAHPALNMAMQLSGQDGTAPSQGFFPIRQAEPVRALTGIDLNAPGRNLETSIRQGLGQPEVSDPVQQATLRRIDELAVQQTGGPITGRDEILKNYLRAKMDRTGPIWEQAQQEVLRERGMRSLVGFGSQSLAPVGTLGTEEAQISGARAQMSVPVDLSRKITDAARVSPHTHADPQTVQALRQASLSLLAQTNPGMPEPPQVQALFADPSWKNLDHIRDLMYDVDSDLHPLAGGYVGSGSPAKQRIQNALHAYQDVPTVLMTDPRWKNGSSENLRRMADLIEHLDSQPAYVRAANYRMSPSLAGFEAAVKSQRALILRDHPELQEYLDYRKAHGKDATLEDFVNSRP